MNSYIRNSPDNERKDQVARRSSPVCEAAEENPDVTSSDKALGQSTRTFLPFSCE